MNRTNDFSELKADKRIFKGKREKSYQEMREEMFEEMKKYISELRDSAFCSQFPKLVQFKRNLFPALDNLIKQCDIIRDDKLRANKMKIIYVWFNAKRDSYNNLSNINKLTIKQEYQKIEEYKEPKDKAYEAGNINEEKDKHFRSDTDEVDPARIRYNSFN